MSYLQSMTMMSGEHDVQSMTMMSGEHDVLPTEHDNDVWRA